MSGSVNDGSALDDGTTINPGDQAGGEGTPVADGGGDPDGGNLDDSNGSSEGDKVPQWAKKRFATLTAQREQANRKAADAAKRAEDAAAEVARLKAEFAKAKTSVVGKPRMDDFENDEEYFDALTDWKLEQRAAKDEEARKANRKERDKQTAQQSFAKTVESINDVGRDKYQDYEELVFSMPGDVMSQEMVLLLAETTVPADIAYHLAKNPQEALKISKMPIHKRAMAIGRIEDRILIKSKTPDSATAPINPGKTNKGAPVGDSAKLVKKNVKEWMRLRNEGKI